MRADLHVHSCYSRQSGNFRFLRSRDCYSTPSDVHATAKRRGMDLVTITDHDTIDGCLALLDSGNRPDVFISEEVSCLFPDTDLVVHLGVYGLDESLHREIQRLRTDVFAVIETLRRAQTLFSLNHLFHFYREQVPLEAYLRLLGDVPAIEARNGTMLRAHNDLAVRLAREWGVAEPYALARRHALLGGSDAHTLRRIGQTWTEAPGATRDEFLANLRSGLGEPGGSHGTALTVAGDAYGVVSRFVASLLGMSPRDHHGLHRLGCLSFVAISLPAQFLPVVFAMKAKRGERTIVETVEAMLAARASAVSPATSVGDVFP
jgi:predicted metal-dependent phosphoesterase TrpH